MKYLKKLRTLFFKGFSPIVATICIGLLLFGIGYYFLAYRVNMFPNLKFGLPKVLKSGEVTTTVIEITEDSNINEKTSPQVSNIALDIDLVEGQSSKVLGTDMFIKALNVDDLTGRGCLGGPLGCADRVEVEVSRYFIRQTFNLLSPKQGGVSQAGKDKATAFGYTFSLIRINDKSVTIRVEIIE